MNEISTILYKRGYTLLENIGTGGFSTVYKVMSHKYNVFFAVKIIETKDEYLLKSKIQSFKNETSILGGIQNNFIVNIYDFFEENNYFFIILEYCPGGTVEKYVRGKANVLLENSRNQMLFQMFSAVDFCHKNNIAHHDIKPSNFFIGDFQRIKLGDFGCAAREEGMESKRFAGTCCYLAPEVSINNQYDPFKADIWSLGVTVLEIATHHLPSFSCKKEDILDHISKDCQCLEKCSQPYIKEIVLRCLETVPEKRANIQELIEIIRQHLPQSGVKKNKSIGIFRPFARSNDCYRVRSPSRINDFY